MILGIILMILGHKHPLNNLRIYLMGMRVPMPRITTITLITTITTITTIIIKINMQVSMN